MITRKNLLLILGKAVREDQPVLARVDGDRWGVIALFPKWNTGGSIQLSRINLSLEGGSRKFGTQWVRYNQWLFDWYQGVSLGPIAANTNEHRTQLRAAGYGEERVEKTIEDLRIDRLRYEEYKKADRG